MFKHLKESDVQAIIEAAECNNAAHPPSELVLLLKKHANGVDDLTRQGLR